MLNKIKNLNSQIKHLPNKFISFNTKIIVYLGLLAYWGVILLGTFTNI